MDIFQKSIEIYVYFKSHHPKRCIKSTPYALASAIFTIVTSKNLQQTRLKELRKAQHLKEYTAALINKGCELVEKIPQEERRTPKMYQRKTFNIYLNMQQKQLRTILRISKKSKST